MKPTSKAEALIFYPAPVSTLITNNLFENNHSGANSGILNIQGEATEINNNEFINKKAENSGVGLYVYGSNYKITHTTPSPTIKQKSIRAA